MHIKRVSARPHALVAVVAVVASLLVVVVGTSAPAGAAAPAGFSDQAVIGGLDQPMDVEFSPDGRVYVAEKTGRLVEYDSLSDSTPTTVLNLTTKVNSFHDRGLMSFALAPNFPVDPHVWVLYAYDFNPTCGKFPCWGQAGQDQDDCPANPGGTTDGCVITGRLSRFDLSKAAGGAEKVLVQDWCQQYDSHSLGHLEFGPDGYLYASAGDGASYGFDDYGQGGGSLNPVVTPKNPCGDPVKQGGALRAQDYQTAADRQGLDGSIIRIDPSTGAGAPSNPMAGSSDANARRIIASGLRNPFRFAFRPGTNELWIGDVGYNTWEELNRLVDPNDNTVHNFGWPCQEGSAASSYASQDLPLCENIYQGKVATLAPYFTYQHGSPVVAGDGCADANGSSISGDAFYTGDSYPAAYHDALFFADYSRGCLWTMKPDANGLIDPATAQLFESDVYPVDLEAGPNGDLFYVDIANGELHRIHATGGNTPPTAAVSATPDHGAHLPLHVTLDASGSSDAEPGTLTYAWDLDGDGQFDDATGSSVPTTYAYAGVYQPAVQVTDAGNERSVATAQVLAGTTPPRPTIARPLGSQRFAVGEKIAYAGGATDKESGKLGAGRLHWKVLLHHCPTDGDHCHVHPLTGRDGVDHGTFAAIDHEYPMYLELRLTANEPRAAGCTAARGCKPATSSVSRLIYPKVHKLTVRTDPPGLTATVDDTTDSGPFTTTVVEGSRHGVSLPAVQTLGHNTLTFKGWSDRGARAHQVLIGRHNLTLTARYDRTVTTDDSLVAAYTFDQGSGSTVTDTSGHGNDGTFDALAGPTWTTHGRMRGALTFDGVDDQVTVPDANSLDLTTGMTLEAWVRPSDVSKAWRSVLLKEKPDTGLSYALYSSSDVSPGGLAWIDGETAARGSTALPLNTWTHLAVTFDGSELLLYLDGVLAGSVPKSGSITASGGPLSIGGDTGFGGEWFKGRIDEVRIYNRALSAAEVYLDQDPAPPTVRIKSPAAGAKLRGNATLKAAASDVGGVASVRFRVDGTRVGAEDLRAPYSTVWRTARWANGKHKVTAVARDRFGNVASSTVVTVKVANR